MGLAPLIALLVGLEEDQTGTDLAVTLVTAVASLAMGFGVLSRHRATWYAGFLYIPYLTAFFLLFVHDMLGEIAEKLEAEPSPILLVGTMVFVIVATGTLRLWYLSHPYFRVHPDARRP
ncbi:MAG: hypothetical protein EA425_07750 [Puniceicoccaceae bacterium]|nr:MAG: hypothetical protein EA425_07750 [Puniceicoccaceae bacterium]